MSAGPQKAVTSAAARPSLTLGVPRPDRALTVSNVTKVFDADGVQIRAVDDISFRVEPGERIGILGSNGAGKSTLIKMLAGVIVPTSGTIQSGISMSWPLALGGGFFEGHLTGYDNTRFVARLYQRPFDEILDFVASFSELTRKQLQTPVKYYSSGMMLRLAFALSLSIDFECILIDEVIVVGDRRFQAKCIEEVFVKRRDRAIILAVHAVDVVRDFCDRTLIMKAGRGRMFDDMELAARIYTSL